MKQQQDQHWDAGATDIQQLNPFGPDQRQNIKSRPNKLSYKYLGRSWDPTRRCAIK